MAKIQRVQGQALALTGIILIGLSTRQAISGVSPLVAVMVGDLPFDATSVGMLGAIPTAAFAAMGFLALPLARQYKLEHLVLAALFLALAGQVGRSLGTSVAVFLLFSLLTVVGLGLVNIVVPPLILRYFPERIGLITSLYVTLLCLSTAVGPQLAVPLADLSNWRVSIGVWSVLVAAAAVPWTVLILRPTPLEVAQEPFSAEDASAKRRGIEPWKSSIGWGLALVFAGSSGNTFAMFAWLPSVLLDRGVSQGEAGSMLALYAVIGLPTSLLVPLMVTKLKRPLPVALFFTAMFLVGYAGLALAPSGSAAPWVLAAGLGQGTYSFAVVMINQRTRTTGASGKLSGFAQGVGYSLASLAPLVFAIFHDTAGGWVLSFGMLTVWLVVLVIGAFMVNEPRMLEEERYSPPGRGVSVQSGDDQQGTGKRARLLHLLLLLLFRRR